MGSLTDYAENELVDHLLGTAYTPVATVYLALSTADPLDAGSGLAEPTYTGYARKAITLGAAASRRVTQSGAVTYDPCTAGSADATHWAIMDALTSGNAFAHGALSDTVNIVAGNTPSVATAEVYVEISAGHISNYAANNLLDLMFRNQAFSAPSTYAALTTATIGDADTGSTITEVSGGSYARKQINENGGASPAWSLASGGAASNGADAALTDPTADWGEVVATALCDAASAGNLLGYDNDTIDQDINNGDTVKFASGDLDVSLS